MLSKRDSFWKLKTPQDLKWGDGDIYHTEEPQKKSVVQNSYQSDFKSKTIVRIEGHYIILRWSM